MEKIRSTIYKLLRKSEQYTKTDMVYLADGGFWLLLTQIVASLSGFFVTLVLANNISQEMYGEYRFIFSLIPLLTLFTLPGIATALTHSVARGNYVNFGKIIRAKINWGSISFILTLLVGLYYFSSGNNSLAYVFFVSAIFIPFFEVFFLYSYYYKGRENFKTSSIYESISRIIQSIIVILVVLITKNLIAILLAYFLSKLVTNLFFYLRTIKKERLETMSSEKEDETKHVVTYGKKLTVTGIFGILSENLDKLLIWAFLSATILATYHVALTIPLTIVLILNIVPRIAFPKFSKRDWNPHERKDIIKKLLVFFTLLLIPTVLYLIFIPAILPWLFSNYETSIPIALLFSCLIPIMPVNAVLAQIFRATKSIWQIVFLQIVVIATMVITFLLTYKTLGIYGSATALITSEIALLIVGIILFIYMKPYKQSL